ncbi:putative fibrillin-1 [Apostichopus japonicus]|uniref:Putative fibrillin-1 n=1 Tax=Stichopus japonicus TaxID=307972 RepID=A0A2G8JVS9_STIJA|nr:putative fibrillin-1 [Apostichopus japonicus]
MRTPTNYTCWANSKCQNTNGSYTCVCENGYSAVGKTCMDVDECSLQVTDPNITNCHPDAICSNTDGSYNCNCKDGFTGDGTVCEDIDECVQKGITMWTYDTSKCIITNGSYRCSCHRGYRNVDGCIDIDECRENLHNCDRLATCINKNGSFDCNCSDGYSGNGTHCIDINECSGEHDCHGAATCLNTPGSYTCQCSDGFTSVGERLGRNCADVNECNGTSPLCDGRTELCRNTIGSYQCSCKNGLVKDSSQTCIDIDECLDQNRCTGNNSRCVNTFGSFSCLCKSGYILDTSGRCIKANFISLQVEFKTIQGLKSDGDLIDRQNLEIYRADMESDIHAVFNGTGGYKSLTISSMKYIPARNHIFIHVNLEVTVGTNYSSLEIVFRQGLDENNVLPPDNVVDPASLYFGELLIDPCADGNHNCTNNAECIFLGQSGHFNCTCRDGWTGDGVAQCKDENECLTSACGSREVCINREGDFLCECNLEEGYARVSEDCIASQVFTTNFSIQEIDGTPAVFNKLLESTVSTEFVSLNTTLCKLIFFNTLEGTNYADSYAMCKVRRFKLPNLTAEVALIFERTPSIAPDELENTLNRRLTDHDYILDNGFSNITLRSENITLDEPECRNNNTCPRNQLCINSECVCDRRTGFVETDEDGCQVSKILKVTFAIVEINSQEAIFNDSLTDRTSNFFMSLQNLVCDLWSITVNNFDGRKWKDDYISCRVLRFFKGSIGETWIWYLMRIQRPTAHK